MYAFYCDCFEINVKKQYFSEKVIITFPENFGCY